MEEFEPKDFIVEIPTGEIEQMTNLVAELNNVSSSIVNLEMTGTTMWLFPSLTVALKSVLKVHQSSPEGKLISHRLIINQNVFIQYGDFFKPQL